MTGVVAGVDPSIASTGVVVLGDERARFERVRSKTGDASIPARVSRMRDMVTRIHGVLREETRVDLVVVEGPAFASPNQMGHMLAGFWWLLAGALSDVAPIAVVQPSTLKKFATGDGSRRTGKRQMVEAARRAFPKADIRNDDVADAAALAAMGAVWLGLECGGVFAPSGMGSVQAVRWPDLERDESR